MKVEIVNWAKYNPRSDVKATSWFRVQNTFWHDPAITPLDNDGKMVWLMLLSFASSAQSGVVDVDTSFMATVLKVTEEKIDATFKHLQAKGTIKLPTSRSRNAGVTLASRKRDADVTTRNVRTGRDERDARTNETVSGDLLAEAPPLESELDPPVQGEPKPAALEAPAIEREHFEPTQALIAEPIATKPARKPKPPTGGSLVWQTYREAYALRYGHEPEQNAKGNAHCMQLVKRLGVDQARMVVAFFLTHNKRWYVEKCHMISCCVHDAEALRTQMLANHRVSSADAHEQDRRQSNLQAFDQAAAILAEREAGDDFAPFG